MNSTISIIKDLYTMFLGLNGVSTSSKPPKDTTYFWYDAQGIWRASKDDYLYQIDNKCVEIHNAIASKLFNGIRNYYNILPLLPSWVREAGLNSESKASKTDFEKLVNISGNQDLHKCLYLFDYQKIVSSIQEAAKEIVQLQGEFYKRLNQKDIFYPPGVTPDGLRFISSPDTTLLTALINIIYIKHHSLLDYVTKLSYEAEHIRTNFDRYPRLSSKNKQFGDRKKISFDKKIGTLFETHDLISEIEAFRNLIIHDGFLDEQPKVYELREKGIVLERFILMPDRSGGRLTSFINRGLFYSDEDKINLRLPSLIAEFQHRLLSTLEQVLTTLKLP